MTRLVADGWLERRRKGRQSYYRFTDAGRARATEAAARIYAAGPTDWSGTWWVQEEAICYRYPSLSGDAAHCFYLREGPAGRIALVA